MKNETMDKIAKKAKEIAHNGIDEGERFLKIFCSLSSEEQSELIKKSYENVNPNEKKIESIINEVSNVVFRKYLIQLEKEYQ